MGWHAGEAVAAQHELLERRQRKYDVGRTVELGEGVVGEAEDAEAAQLHQRGRQRRQRILVEVEELEVLGAVAGAVEDALLELRRLPSAAAVAARADAALTKAQVQKVRAGVDAALANVWRAGVQI